MIDYHRRILIDGVRVRAFDRAIRERVEPGDVVVDIGTGTGVLACLACRAGAGRVYAIERGDVIQVAREIATANGYSDRITFIQSEATSVDLPEKANVVIGELLGSAGLEENIVEIFAYFCRKWLEPGGRLIPETVEVFFAPWEEPDLHELLASWGREHHGLDFGPCRSLSFNQFYSIRTKPDGKLSEAMTLWDLSLADVDEPGPLSATAEFEIERGGVLHGFAAWFTAALSPGTRLSTSPYDPPTCWKQAFFPIEAPIEVQPGDRATLTVTATKSGDDMLWGWKGHLDRDAQPRTFFSAHMFLGLVPSLAAMLRRTTGTNSDPR